MSRSFLTDLGMKKDDKFCNVWAKTDKPGWNFASCLLAPGHEGNHKHGDLEWEGTPSYELAIGEEKRQITL
jgi:hypothetical protein